MRCGSHSQGYGMLGGGGFGCVLIITCARSVSKGVRDEHEDSYLCDLLPIFLWNTVLIWMDREKLSTIFV